MSMRAGTHFILELYGCDAEVLKQEAVMCDHAVAAAKAAGLTVLNVYAKAFKDGGQGISVVVALGESHLSIHTWPERHYAALDLFTSGEADKGAAALETLREWLRPEHYDLLQLPRGGRFLEDWDPILDSVERVTTNVMADGTIGPESVDNCE